MTAAGPAGTGGADDPHPGPGPAGRRPGRALAIDIGGTKLAAAVVDLAGRFHGRARTPSPTGDDPEALYRAVRDTVRAALLDAGQPAAGAGRELAVAGDLAGVGVGCAGPMRWPDGVVSPLNMPAWRDFPLRLRLARDLRQPPERVLVHNDAVALAAGEHWKGAGVGTGNLLAVTVSTGVGGGLVLAGHLFHGKSGNGGHIGHVVVEPDGPVCACGGRGCLEAVASGPSTVARAMHEGWQGPADGVSLAASAAAGDPIAVRNLARAGRGVGVALASCANLLDLEVVAVSGGFSRSGEPFWGPLRATFATRAQLGFSRGTPVLHSAIPDDAGLLGAAAFVLAPERYGW